MRYTFVYKKSFLYCFFGSGKGQKTTITDGPIILNCNSNGVHLISPLNQTQNRSSYLLDKVDLDGRYCKAKNFFSAAQYKSKYWDIKQFINSKVDDGSKNCIYIIFLYNCLDLRYEIWKLVKKITVKTNII